MRICAAWKMYRGFISMIMDRSLLIPKMGNTAPLMDCRGIDQRRRSGGIKVLEAGSSITCVLYSGGYSDFFCLIAGDNKIDDACFVFLLA